MLGSSLAALVEAIFVANVQTSLVSAWITIVSSSLYIALFLLAHVIMATKYY
jgi:hypothetical protein